DGKTLDTAAIQKTIDACHAAGGGTVLFPTGKFLSGTIHLKSNVTLHLTPGATLLGSADIADYPPQKSRYVEGIIDIEGKNQKGYPMRHLIYACGAENIGIEGRGFIDGNGAAFFNEGMTVAHARPTPLIELINCRNLRVTDAAIRNAPGWTLHPKNCDGVYIRGVSIINHPRAINSDGIDVDSSRNVIISDCRIEAGDDCIVLKTTKMGDATPPVENVVVTNCVLQSSATALKLGTESHGDYRRVLFSNCVIHSARTGLGLICKDGGTMENVRFDNITLLTRRKWGKGYEIPIIIELSKRNASSPGGVVRNIAFSGITIETNGRVMAHAIDGLALEDISFSNINYRIGGYETLSEATRPSPVTNKSLGMIPSAFIFKNVKGLRLENVSAVWPSVENAPARSLLYFDNVDNPVVESLHGGASAPGAETISRRQ
ncbi:MAG: glycoside hydrolase family 28 protein, partial [Opitutaceae bacterium]|nr:glycoside hydrolase family 28 protein [Opitutaceae bacterium]